jgi:hypothetical protein
MNPVLAANLELLARGHPGLARLVSESPACAEISIVPSARGCPSARTAAGFLHSRVDPIREAGRFIGQESPDEPEFGLFFGLGLGYAAEAFLRAWPGRPLYVIEPSLSDLAAWLSGRDMRELLAHSGLHLLAGIPAAGLSEYFREVEDLRPRLFRWKPLIDRHSDYYRAAEAGLKRFFGRREINTNTLRRFGRLWVRNLARNYPLMWRYPGLGRIEGALAGLPALVIAGGPSLDNIVPHLHDIRQRCAIIAVDTSFSLCRRSGLQPDFLVVADPQYWNTRHLDRQTGDASLLVSEPSTHPVIFRRFGHRVILAGSIFPLGSFFESFTDVRGRLGAGGSVATSAWDLARQLGCRPICMAGLDLGFPGKQTHFRGSFFEERVHGMADRLAPAEQWSVQCLLDASPGYATNNSGGRTLTDRRMLLYKWWFERQLELYPTAATFNLSAEGIAIAGMAWREFDFLLDLPVIRTRLDDALQDLAGLPGSAAAADGPKEAVQSLLDLLGEMARIAARGRMLVEKGRARLRTGGQPDLAAFDAVDARLAAISQREVAGFLIQEASLDIQRSEARNQTEILDNLEKLYSGLEKSAQYQCELFSRSYPA